MYMYQFTPSFLAVHKMV